MSWLLQPIILFGVFMSINIGIGICFLLILLDCLASITELEISYYHYYPVESYPFSCCVFLLH